MKVPVVRTLVETVPLEKIQEAILAFEKDRTNILNVEGADDGEKLSHLLVAEFALKKIAKGMKLNEALREYSQRVRSMIKS